MIIEDDIMWLIKWFQIHGNIKEGNEIGIEIATLDNPGWFIEINLINSNLKNIEFSKIKIDRSENDWIRCKVVNSIFQGFCGPLNFPEILKIFRKWADTYSKNPEILYI